jgi:hypothetical protein
MKQNMYFGDIFAPFGACLVGGRRCLDETEEEN